MSFCTLGLSEMLRPPRSLGASKELVGARFEAASETGAPSGSMLGGSGNDAAFSQTVNDATDIIVFIGGVYQIPTTNYSVSGQQITFGSAPPANDGSTNGHIITVIHGLHKLGE